MMMMTFRRKKISLGILLLPAIVLLFIIRSGELGSPDGRQQVELQTFQLGDGWGYRIMLNEEVLIYQPTIPAIDTLMKFPTEKSAYTIGSLVLERLKENEDFSVSIEEVKHSLSH